MNLEETTNELANIRQTISDLKEMEEIYLLVKLCHDVKNILMYQSTEEIKIYKDDSYLFLNKGKYTDFDIKFKIEFIQNELEGKEKSQKDNLYNQIFLSNQKFKTNDYKNEYENIVNILNKKMKIRQIIAVNKNTNPEDFLKQIDNGYAIKYNYYEINKNLAFNDKPKSQKLKI